MREMEIKAGESTITFDTGRFLRQRPDGALEVSPFTSIPAASWWVLATITTVGYGDIVPVTTLGKLVGSVAILYGTVLLGLPIGIIGSQFSTEFGRMLIVSRRRAEIMRERLVVTTVKRQRTLDFDEQHSASLGSRTTDPPDGAGTGESTWSNNFRQSVRARLSSVSVAFVPAQRKMQMKATEMAADRIANLPLSDEDGDSLRTAKNNFEDAVRIHGDLMGIPVEQQQQWCDALTLTEFAAGPALDRLGVRVLSALADVEEMRPSANLQTQQIRIAWHELCWMCCRVTQVMQEARDADALAELKAENDKGSATGSAASESEVGSPPSPCSPLSPARQRMQHLPIAANTCGHNSGESGRTAIRL
eukprot:gnl/TRDRNA2_/TRDRNA2_167769_c0_seq2.p1 gnl/TRDRNA2_/TRDRNA2_167769_c0~~gnl/TRDRNA2_/TRDRNA2_167769_c0_seq2.p1  ORF type:complete len:363 (+),score=58.03 gnl/TRDRNA2_/TRDRNA2_167769_c0_seq2:88-1176(+)